MGKWKPMWQGAQRRGKAMMGGWSAFMEKQGFYLMLGLCVAVIVGSAIWTRSNSVPVVPPENPIADLNVGVQPDFVQRMDDVHWATAAPGATTSTAVAKPQTPAQPAFAWPAQGEVTRKFSQKEPVFLPTLGAWAIHEGLDIALAKGEPVRAVLDGKVKAAYADPMLGNVMVIAHEDGWETRYAGLETLELLKVGDPVKAGQLLSPLGAGAPIEAEDVSHLHFEVLKAGEPADPLALLGEKK